MEKIEFRGLAYQFYFFHKKIITQIKDKLYKYDGHSAHSISIIILNFVGDARARVSSNQGR